MSCMPITCTRHIFKTLSKMISPSVTLRIKKWMRFKVATPFLKMKKIHLSTQANNKMKWSCQDASRVNNKTAIKICFINLIWFPRIIWMFCRWIWLKHQGQRNFCHSKNINKGKVMGGATLQPRCSHLLPL